LEELQRLPHVSRVDSGGDLDFILTWTDPPTELLTASARGPRYGVWKYQFGDWVNYRGEPAGFWEVHQRQSFSGAMLVRLTNDPDAVIVLREGYMRSNLHSAGRNRTQLQQRCIHWAAQVCTDIRNGVLSRLTGQPRRTTARVRRPPTSLQLLQHR